MKLGFPSPLTAERDRRFKDWRVITFISL